MCCGVHLHVYPARRWHVGSISLICLCVHVCVLQMKEFALKGYKKVTSLAFHKAPNSALGRVIGLLYR